MEKKEEVYGDLRGHCLAGPGVPPAWHPEPDPPGELCAHFAPDQALQRLQFQQSVLDSLLDSTFTQAEILGTC